VTVRPPHPFRPMKLSLTLLLLLSPVALLAQPKAAGPILKPVDFTADPAAMEFAKDAGAQAIRAWLQEFVTKQTDAKTFAVVPFDRDIDGGYFTSVASSEFAGIAAGTPLSLYASTQDPVLETLNKEMMSATEFREDIFDQKTVQKFSRVNVQGLIMGRVAGVYYAEQPAPGGVRVEGFENKAIQVRIVMRAYENSTGRILWGGEKVATVALPIETLTVKRNWILYAGAGVGVLLLIFILHRTLAAANRPR